MKYLHLVLMKNGDDSEAHCIVILDGCSAHKGIGDWLRENRLGHIHVISLPVGDMIEKPMTYADITKGKRKFAA